MRKECVQTYAKKSLAQKLTRGGFRKTGKKVLASVLAAAMVLTSGVIVPQNSTVAEAADGIYVGTDNGDGTYTLDWWNYANFYGQETSAGDFSLSFSFHNDSAGANNYQNYAVAVTTDLSATAQAATDWYLRCDAFNNSTFTDSTVTYDYGNINWDTFASILKDANVGVSVVRSGTTITISHSVANAAGDTITWSATATNCPTDAVKVWLGGEACALTPTKEVRTITVKQQYEDGTEAAADLTQKVFEGHNYSITPTAIDGFTPDQATVTGTAGASDAEVTVTYTSAAAHTLTVEYMDAGGYQLLDPVTQTVDEGKTYSVKSPSVAGMAPDITTVTGTMGDADTTVIVQYKDVIATVGTDNGDGTYTQGFADTANYYSVIKKAGDFDVSFSFHNDSPGTDNWFNYILVCNSAAGTSWTQRADCYAVADPGNTAFGGQAVTYGSTPDWTTFSATMKDAEVGVSVSRVGTTMTMTNNVVGVNGLTFSWTATVENCPTDMMTIYLGGDASKQSIYNATESDTIEAQTVTVHYVNASGKTVAEDVVEEVEGGQTYSITSPTIAGYVADKKVVSGTMGDAAVEVTVTYKKTIATVGTDNGDGTYTLGFNSLASYYPVVKQGDFDVSFSFHNNSACEYNWNNYAVIVRTSAGSEWYQRADRWSNSDVGNTAFGGNAVSYEGGPDWNTFAATIKDAEVGVTVSRRGTTMTISHNVVGGNGISYSWSSSVTCPLDNVTVYLGGEACKLDVYSATASDKIAVEAYPVTVHYVYEDGSKAADDATAGPLEVGGTYYIPSPEIEGYTADLALVSGTIAREPVIVTVTYKPEKTEPIASVGKNEDGSFSLGFNDLANYHEVKATGDFELTFQFHQEAPGDVNWNSYAVVVKNAAGSEWYHRADLWSVSPAGNTAFDGQPVTYSGGPSWDTFLETMKEADCTVKVVRSGSTMSMVHSVAGANGVSYGFTSTVTNCPTDEVSVWLGGEKVALTIWDASIKGQTTTTPSEEPTQAPSDPTAEPSDPTQAPSDPTVEPSNPTQAPADPTTAPSVAKGDKVSNSNGSYKVTNTDDKTVKYVADKDNKKNVTVSNTVKVDGEKYKVTTIAKNAFKGNTDVTKITIGKNVTKIEANAFKNCKNLKTIVIKSTKLTSVAKNALKGTNAKLVIKVPAKKVKAYAKLFAGKGNDNVVVKKA